MTKLTNKQESFAQSIASGMNQSDAYRSAYNTAKMADKVIWTNASMLANHNKVLIRISELKAALVTKILWTRERSVDVLSKIAEEDIYKGGEKVAAVRELNLMHGFNEPIKIDPLIGDRTITITRATKPK